MLTFGNAALVCLLAVAGFSGNGDAARPREQRGLADPWLVSPPGQRPDDNVRRPARDLGEKVFTLRHVYHHGSHQYPDLHRYLDIPQDAQLSVADEFGQKTEEAAPVKLRARAVSTNIERMADRRRSTIDNILNFAAIHGEAMDLPASEWTVDEIAGPNYTHKPTVLTMAKMAANAYVTEPWTGEWQDVKGGFNYTDDFGWESDGLRGHIFADETNETVVIGLKGTSMAVFDGAETTGNDKVNDNLFGSCCCGQGGQYMWKQVCDCMTSAYTCNSTCLVKSLREKSHYYWAAQDLYRNVTERYPTSEVWMSGHSLGGVVGTLLGFTYGLPVITFEAFPDALAAQRLGLPVPPGYKIGSHQSRRDTAIHHFGHTADPVFMGSCNAASSLCTLAGYAFESYCHTGKTCIYDTVGDLGWRVGVGTHRIVGVIRDVIEKYDEVPVCEEDLDCVDCYNWKFFESNGSETSMRSRTSESTRTRTRTETCKTPGWWGCLDETSTSMSMTTTSTTISSSSDVSSSSSTSTCETPGWFGCKDETTTTSSSSHSTAIATTPSAAPAPTLTAPSSHPTSTTPSAGSSSITTTCETPGWFGCNDPTPTSQHLPTSSASSSSTPSSTHLPTTRRKTCVHRAWYGRCREWRWEDLVGVKSDL